MVEGAVDRLTAEHRAEACAAGRKLALVHEIACAAPVEQRRQGELGSVEGQGRSYGWEGGAGTIWFNGRDVNGEELIAIALTQSTDFLFGGAAEEFTRLVVGC